MPNPRPKVAFLFTGQGSQYVGMGRCLYAEEPEFRRVLDRCAELLRPHLDHDLRRILYPEPGAEKRAASLLGEALYSQSALFAFEVSLAAWWRSQGLEPDVVTGHSIGELAAAWVAGVFSLEDGIRLVAERAERMQGLDRRGAMAMAACTEAEARAALGEDAGEVSIAAVNGPRHVLVSGTRRAVAAVLDRLEGEFVFTRLLQVSHAFHSPLMEPMLEGFERAAAALRFQPPRLPVISSLTGAMLPPGDIPGALHWRRHVREAVRFHVAVDALLAAQVEVFLEIGPHDVLCQLGRKCVPAGTGTWLASARRDDDSMETPDRSVEALRGLGFALEPRRPSAEKRALVA